MKTLAPAAFALAAILALDASAQTAPAPPAAKAAAKPARTRQACFWRRNIEGFAAIDDTSLYLRANVSDVYELKLMTHCLDLEWVHHVGLDSFGDFEPMICEGPNPGIDVVVRDIGIGRMRCPVIGVHKLTPPEIAALPRGARP